MAADCAQCGGVVAIDAERCPHCGTRDIAKLGRVGSGAIAAFGVALVLGLGWLLYRTIFAG